MMTSKIQKRVIGEYLHRGHIIALKNIFLYGWESDVLTISKSKYAYEFEIKRLRSDFRADFHKIWKHNQLKDRLYGPNHFFYVCEKDLIKIDEVPEYAGLLYVHSNGGLWQKKAAPMLYKDKFDVKEWEKIAIKLFYKTI